MLQLIPPAFGCVMLGKVQKGGAALTALCHPRTVGAVTPPVVEPQP